MAGNSLFPRLIDTDDVLYRVTADSYLIPSMHNNHVDALQTVELMVGVTDDGTGSGITPALLTGLSQWLHFPSAATPNPRYPWDTVEDESIYGNDNGSLAEWTLGGGISAAWANPAGLCRLTVPNTANTLIASCPLPAESLIWMGFSLLLDNLAESGVAVGLSINGTGSDLDGFGFYSPGSMAGNARKVENGTRASSGAVFSGTPMQYQFWLRWNGSTVDLYGGVAGLIAPTPQVSITSRGTPTKACIYTTHAPTAASYLWLRYLMLGWSNPANYLGA